MFSFPNAKINIGLNVVARRPDGYHDIETLFYPVAIRDFLDISLRTGGCQPVASGHNGPDFSDEICTFTLRGNSLQGNPADNLVVRACRMLREDFDIPPVSIVLEKNIPSGAGLGGGSSDCASVIIMLNRMFGLRMKESLMQSYAARLGADCAFFVLNRPVLATGIGNVMSPVDISLAGLTMVVAKPDVEVSTREAYSMVTPGRPATALSEVVKRPLEDWREIISNDFEKSVFELYPEVRKLKDVMYALGAVYSAMSGSGSAVYGIFRDDPGDVNRLFEESDCRVFKFLLQ